MSNKYAMPILKHVSSEKHNKKQDHFEYFQHLEQKLLNQSDKMTSIFSTKPSAIEYSGLRKSDHAQDKKKRFIDNESVNQQKSFESGPKISYEDIMAKLHEIKKNSQKTIQNLKSLKQNSQKQSSIQPKMQFSNYQNYEKMSLMRQSNGKQIGKIINLIAQVDSLNSTTDKGQSPQKIKTMKKMDEMYLKVPKSSISQDRMPPDSSPLMKQIKIKNIERNSNTLNDKPNGQQSMGFKLLKKTSTSSSRSSAQLINEVNKITKRKKIKNIPEDYDHEEYYHQQNQQQTNNQFKFDFIKRTSSSSTSSISLIEDVKKLNKIKSKNHFNLFSQFQLPVLNQSLSIDDFQIIKFLQEGQFGSVYISRHKRTNFICALKKITKKIFEGQQKFINQLIRQIKIQAFLDHPNIVQLYSYFSDEDNFYLMMELCCNGNVYNNMKIEGYFTEEKVKTIIKQVSHAIQYMHDNDIIHRDIKPQNILLHENVAKVCDFGWSIHSPMLRGTLCGTPLYSSPEMIQNQSYDNKIDIWNIGILTYELLYGVVPFEIRNHEQLIKIVEEQIYFPKSIAISQAAKGFINNCLHKNSKERYSMAKLIDHQFLH